MGDEINRLAVFEAESQRKDGVIGQLRSDMESLAMQSHQAQQVQQKPPPVADTTVQKRLKELEKDVNLKQLEVNALKEKVSRSSVMNWSHITYNYNENENFFYVVKVFFSEKTSH